MKHSTLGALALGCAVLGVLLAHVVTRQPPTDGVVRVLLGALVFAALLWDSELVDGWIKAAIDRLPSFGRRGEPPAG